MPINKKPPVASKKKVRDPDDEDIFLADLVERYSFWKARNRKDYAEAFKVLLGSFTIKDEDNK